MATRKPPPAKTTAKTPLNATSKRVRRTPEQARTAILEAAERVFATRLPDVAGLKDVAHEAGVSHALVTHYFGTYEALVEATLERRFQRIREELVPVVTRLVNEQADAKSILAAYRNAIAEAISDPATLRLGTWAMLSGRAAAEDFFPHRVQSLKLLVDVASARSTAPREDIEFLFITSFAIAVTSAFAPRALAGSLGHKPTRQFDDAFTERVDRMLADFLRGAERRGR